jgi:hypothetical protein
MDCGCFLIGIDDDDDNDNDDGYTTGRRTEKIMYRTPYRIDGKGRKTCEDIIGPTDPTRVLIELTEFRRAHYYVRAYVFEYGLASTFVHIRIYAHMVNP